MQPSEGAELHQLDAKVEEANADSVDGDDGSILVAFHQSDPKQSRKQIIPMIGRAFAT